MTVIWCHILTDDTLIPESAGDLPAVVSAETSGDRSKQEVITQFDLIIYFV